MKKVIMGLIIGMILIMGCTQQQTTTSCIEYCNNQTRGECNGYWNSTGIYPNCNCEWECIDAIDIISTCTSNWVCTEWSECNINNLKTRTCTDSNNCNTTLGMPSLTQTCTYVNLCNGINDATKKANCNSIIYEDASKCLSTTHDSCVMELAKLTFNESICDKINNSVNRNNCKAIVSNDRTKCNILAPEFRQSCYNNIDEFLNYRALIEGNTQYCNLITNKTLYPYNECVNQITKNNELNYLTNYSICEKYGFTINKTDYQMIYSCYMYHIKKGTNPCETLKNVPGLQEAFYNECIALVNNNISYCYDFNSSMRDNCFANFADLRNDTLTCRDATSNENCLSIGCRYLENIEFCNKITDKVIKSVHAYNLGSACTSYTWKECDINYCTLITDITLKDACIYNTIRNDKLKEYKFINSI